MSEFGSGNAEVGIKKKVGRWEGESKKDIIMGVGGWQLLACSTIVFPSLSLEARNFFTNLRTNLTLSFLAPNNPELSPDLGCLTLTPF